MRAGARSTPVAFVLLLGACNLHACKLGDVAAPRFDATGTAVVVVPPRDFVSGTRLRERYDVVDGLVEVLAGWHDGAGGGDSGRHAAMAARATCLRGRR